MAKELNPRQAAFVDEYLLDLNATQAAIRAGYSQKTAGQMGHDLLKIPEIQDAIAAAGTRRSERTQIDAAWMLKRLADEAEADVADLYTEAGGLKPIHEWPKIWRQGLVAGLDIEQIKGPDGSVAGDLVKIKLSDRIRRLELIGKHVSVNAFQEVVQHKGLEGLAARLDRAKKRRGE